MYQLRRCKTYTISELSEVFELNPEDFRSISYPFEGEWYDWVGYRLYVNIRRINNKPVKVENHLYIDDAHSYIGFKLDERDKIFWI